MFIRTIPIRISLYVEGKKRGKKERKKLYRIFKRRGGFNLRIGFTGIGEMKERKRELT